MSTTLSSPKIFRVRVRFSGPLFLKIWIKTLYIPASRSGSQVCPPLLDCSSFQIKRPNYYLIPTATVSTREVPCCVGSAPGQETMSYCSFCGHAESGPGGNLLHPKGVAVLLASGLKTTEGVGG